MRITVQKRRLRDVNATTVHVESERLVRGVRLCELDLQRGAVDAGDDVGSGIDENGHPFIEVVVVVHVLVNQGTGGQIQIRRRMQQLCDALHSI